ncbi:MAG: hypothetical protein PHZ14_10960 [Sulfuricella sp.]|nr:hypothetical protein [Sulfuricella sp.]
MSANDINNLRAHLFATLRSLNDKDNPMDIERARAVSEVAQTIINSAKVEVDAMRVAGGQGSGFFTALPAMGESSETTFGTKTVAHIQGATVTRHRMR